MTDERRSYLKQRAAQAYADGRYEESQEALNELGGNLYQQMANLEDGFILNKYLAKPQRLVAPSIDESRKTP